MAFTDITVVQYYFETIFPRIPKPVTDALIEELKARKLPYTPKGNGGAGGRDRRGVDDGGKRPASVKASLSVALGQRAPNRAGAREDRQARALDGGTGRTWPTTHDTRARSGSPAPAPRDRDRDRDRSPADRYRSRSEPDRGGSSRRDDARGGVDRDREEGREGSRSTDSRDRYDRSYDRYDRGGDWGRDRDDPRRREEGERDRRGGDSYHRGGREHRRGSRSRSRSPRDYRRRSRSVSRDRGGSRGRDARDVFKDSAREVIKGSVDLNALKSRYL